MEAVYLLTIHWFASLFCQSFFLHRYCSHHMFKMNAFWEKAFYLLTYLTQGASFLNPTCYSIMHQRHHSHSDTTKDPHSPAHSNGIVDMMLKTYKEYRYLLDNYKSMNHKAPTWEKLDDFAASSYNVYLWILTYMAIYLAMGVPFEFYPLILVHMFVGPIQGAIVNWFGHRVGYRNFKVKDFSRNTLPFDFALMGELYQNNHHKYGQKLNFAHRWFEVDLTYQLSRLLRQLGIIKLERIPITIRNNERRLT